MPFTLIDSPDAAVALSQAVAVRHAGGVPLIVDARAAVSLDAYAEQLPNDTAWAALTSGTTGAPKIVVRTAASWQIAFTPLDRQLGLQPGDGLWMPVHQVSSMALFSAAWADHSGLELVIPNRDDTGLERATVAHLTPTWLRHLVDLLETNLPTTIHTVLVGGDHLPETLLTRARALGLHVVTYVGAAELSFIAWDRGDGMRPFEGVSTRIDDTTLWVASPQTALGVIGGTLRRVHINGTEWVTVGDRAVAHHGALEFLGRTDDAIITAGATALPSDIETIIDGHPEVTGSLVMGVPDAILGQRVVAWIEGDASIVELKNRARSQLPKASRPVQWHRVQELARTASGKIRRVVPEDI